MMTLISSTSKYAFPPLSEPAPNFPTSRRPRYLFVPAQCLQCLQLSSPVPHLKVDPEQRKDPFCKKQQYKDSFLDLLFINGCRQVYGRLAGWQSSRSWKEGYIGMVEVSYALMRSKSAAQQRAAILQGFPKMPEWFRKLFPYSDSGAELNARITPLFFEWLVGSCKVIEVNVGDKVLRSGVQIEKCRYLETSGCTGMCVNLCKVPTQYFFNTELGMPLTMEPNFEDLSCRMIFGQPPPPQEEDSAMQQSCFVNCPSANLHSSSCPKLS